MGSDFYIQIYLKIEHKNGVSYYEIPGPRGYFPELDGICDSDEEEEDHYYYTESFKKLYDDMVKVYLTPRKDLVLFENGKFVKPRFEKKYLPQVGLYPDTLPLLKKLSLRGLGFITMGLLNG